MHHTVQVERPSVRRIGTIATISLLAIALASLLIQDASASGGGGCGRPVTDRTGTHVKIRSFCFGPTVIRTDPGAVVTFRNEDPTAHTVLGANGSWGSFGTLHRGQEVSYRFDRAGVYPYVCTYHPGMVGVVVVGNAGGPGAVGTTTANGPVVHLTPRPSLAATHEPAVVERATTSVGWPLAGGVAIGLLLAAAAIASVRTSVVRRRA